jgi:hypothetical protein
MFWDDPDYDPFMPVNDQRKMTQPSGRSNHSLVKGGSSHSSSGSGSYSGGYRKREVHVLFKNGAKQEYTVEYSLIDWFDYARLVWPFRMEGNTEIIEVPEEFCTFSYGKPRFNQCVYTASGDYIAARWGRKLDISDSDWLAAHPLATDDGIPHGYTPTCVHELVLPYGMGVERIRIKKDVSVLGDHMLGWMTSLGCNPFGMIDRATDNVEAAKRMGMTIEEANALWRFEFHSDPLPGSIIGEKGWSGTGGNTGGVKVGNFGGHSRYLAPRASAGDWTISVQLAPDPTYMAPPPSEPYVPRKGTPSLVASAILDPDKELIAVRNNLQKWIPQSKRVRSIVHWKDEEQGSQTPMTEQKRSSVGPLGNEKYDCSNPACLKPQQTCTYDELLCNVCRAERTGTKSETPQGNSSATSPSSKEMKSSTGAGGAGKKNKKDKKGKQKVEEAATPMMDKCEMCNMTEQVQDFINPLMGFVCNDCISVAFKTFECPHCKADLSKFPPEPLGFNAPTEGADEPGTADWVCTECKQELVTSEPPRSFKGLHPYDVAEYIWDAVDWGTDDDDTPQIVAEGELELVTRFREAVDHAQ